MRKYGVALCNFAALLPSCPAVLGQGPPASLSFEVASIKSVVRIPGPRTKREEAGRVEYRQETVFNLLIRAYGLQAFQISGPEWLKTSYYDVVATLPKSATKADIPQMLRRMLVKRFHLVVRREVRSTPVYAITVGKDGPKLEPCTPRTPTSPPTIKERTGPLRAVEGGECPTNRVVTRGEESMLIEANSLAYLTLGLKDGADRPVFDRTGLAGNFKIALECSQMMAGDDPSGLPTMASALQKFGLKLEPRREDVEYLIVDRGDKNPSEN